MIVQVNAVPNRLSPVILVFADAMQPVAIGPDGTASVCQSLAFAVVRPLQDSVVGFELQLQRGMKGSPQLTLQFKYSLLQLLCKSPKHPLTFEQWRLLKKNRLSGIKV